ncbi:crotonase/enoyl-CoA hydratase family protein [Epidermidibacterium keratini]|uniref:Crotonase/enoyl-CoA hydratase family protein n=1 Tax=Epidermidibacterium keratini TaxID=1891644 RepID=A0A7L4YPV6_9ACTN|nr:crotonase/enoyl-CoA hydratase family protein [Epidermidibacterium keratini]QHC01052.1 crotonase/enoyl-CoA hydratase family protein [Epidermidibacterium keratini]
MTDLVKVDVQDGVGVITLNRPEAKNAVNLEVAQGVADAVDKLEADNSVVALIITGAGGTFCSGMDLKAFARGERPSIPGRGFAGLTEYQLSKPLIAAVEGYALAGGCELALASDIIVAAQTAQFGIPEVKRGLVAAAGGVLKLAKTMPYGAAMELALTGDFIKAERARELGLVTQVTDEGKALDGALELAKRIAQNGPLAVKASKELVSMSIKWVDKDLLEAQKAIIDPVFKSKDAIEGATAFAEKRSPNWTGK